MAIFKLGAIVTSIVGSIGGTNFKRGKNNLIVTNKSFGASRNTLLQNQQLNPIAIIFKRWSQLTSTQRTNWNSSALLFTFPDKFGVLRNITGRELFTKLNIQLLVIGVSLDDPTGINNTLYPFTISTAFVSTGSGTAIINKTGDVLFQKFLIQAEVTKKQIYSPNFTKKKVLFEQLSSGAASLDFGLNFFEAYPYFDNTYNVAFYVTVINEFGFKSVPQFVIATVS